MGCLPRPVWPGEGLGHGGPLSASTPSPGGTVAGPRAWVPCSQTPHPAPGPRLCRLSSQGPAPGAERSGRRPTALGAFVAELCPQRLPSLGGPSLVGESRAQGGPAGTSADRTRPLTATPVKAQMRTALWGGQLWARGGEPGKDRQTGWHALLSQGARPEGQNPTSRSHRPAAARTGARSRGPRSPSAAEPPSPWSLACPLPRHHWAVTLPSPAQK